MKKLLCVLMFGMVFGQAELTTRAYELPRINFQSYQWYYNLNISDITGVELDYAHIKIAKVTDYYIDNDYAEIRIQSSNIMSNGNEYWLYSDLKLEDGGTVQYSTASTRGVTYDGSNSIRFDFEVAGGWVDIILSITAEFPKEDTGYIEEGFDYCIEEGANLIAFPCRDTVPILDTLPSEIASSLTGIIGQGVAATNQNGNWVGSLDGLGGGNGYWMLSNVSACFNYNCEEN